MLTFCYQNLNYFQNILAINKVKKSVYSVLLFLITYISPLPRYNYCRNSISAIIKFLNELFIYKKWRKLYQDNVRPNQIRDAHNLFKKLNLENIYNK